MYNYYWENRYLNEVRFANRSGSHRNCIRIFKNNTYIHEKTKFDICFKLLKEGFVIWTEVIFNDGKRADIMAIREREAYLIEVETPKSKKEMEKKLEQKYKYPDAFDLIVVNTKEFDIEKFKV